MKKHLIFLLCFLPVLQAFANEGNGYVMPRSEVIPIKNSQSGGQYELYVILPNDYAEDENKRHPVIYVTDAVWHIDILASATYFLMSDAILVGISWQIDMPEELLEERGAHVSRLRDYTITPLDDPERQAKYQLGQAANHLEFIRNDVIPFVEERYQTDEENRTYFGYSAGGLFGSYVLINDTDTFKNYILGSPSLSRDIPKLSSMLADHSENSNGEKANVFLSYGNLEKELGTDLREFLGVLSLQGSEKFEVHREVLEGTHSTAFPLTAIAGVNWLAALLGEEES